MLKMTLDSGMREVILTKLTRMQREKENWVVLDLVPGAPMNVQSLSFWETSEEAFEICAFSNQTKNIWEIDQSTAHSDCMSIDELRNLIHSQSGQVEIQFPALTGANHQRELLTYQKTNTMIQKNVSYLADQAKFTGFGEQMGKQIEAQIAQGPAQFQLQHETDFNGQKVSATLDFSKSKESEMYFFNKYTVALVPENGKQEMTQQFYIQQKGQSIALKEAYNLMNGRAVFKEKLANKEGQQYAAWLKLNFKEMDKYQGFKLNTYGPNYGFKLEEALDKHPIMEMVSAADKERLIASLEKGNRVAVTFNEDGTNKPRFIEASPTSHGLNVFDEQHKLLKQEWQPRQAQKEGASEQQSEKQQKRQGQKVV